VDPIEVHPAELVPFCEHRDDVGPWVEFLPVLTDRPSPKT